MNQLLFFVSLLATATSFVALFLGLIVALRADAPAAYSLAAVGATMLVSLLVATKRIWAKSDGLRSILKLFWWIATACAIVAITFAFARHVVLRAPKLEPTSTGEVWRFDWDQVWQADFVMKCAGFLTILFFTFAPMAPAYLKARFHEDHEH